MATVHYVSASVKMCIVSVVYLVTLVTFWLTVTTVLVHVPVVRNSEKT